MHHHQNHLVVWLVHLLLSGVSVYVVAALMPGIKAKSFGSAIAFAFVVGILNAIFWTVLSPVTIPFKYLTLGIGGLILNGIIFLIAAKIVNGVKISGCFTAAFAALGVHFVNWLLNMFLSGWAL